MRCGLIAQEDPTLVDACRERLELLRRAAAAREPVVVEVPPDEELESLPDPVEELRGHLRHLRGRAAQRDTTCAALLRSKFTNGEILRLLPASLVLDSDEQAESVARLIAQTCGDELVRWQSLPTLSDEPPSRKVTFGAWLDALAAASGN
jgi:hypothetical protein